MSERKSSFEFYSLGIVAKNKERNSPFIKVVPIEEMSLASGRSEKVVVKTSQNGQSNVFRKEDKNTDTIDKQTTEYQVEIPDHKGVNRAQKLTGEMMIVAKWLAFGQSNRFTAPDVCAGETVMLFKVADTDEYTWTTIGNEANIRRQETVCYVFGNIPSGTKVFDRDSSYWIEVSTHDKHIKVHTSRNDGEPFAYDFTLDTKRGTFTINDNAGNVLELDSNQGRLSGKLVTEVDITTPLTKFSNDVEIGGNLKVANNTDIGSNLSTGGNAAVGGGLSSGGGGSFGGSVSSSGDITTTGNISASGTVHGSNI